MRTGEISLMTRSMSQPASAIARQHSPKYGVGREEAERQVDEWAKDLKEDKDPAILITALVHRAFHKNCSAK